MKKVLIMGTYVNAPYHSFRHVDEALAEALSTELKITTSDDLARLLTMDEEGYSLCVSYLDMFDKPFPADAVNAVLSFVYHGGGLLRLLNGISLQTEDRLFHCILRNPATAVAVFSGHLAFTKRPP